VKWEKLVERKGDFLKNALMHEGLGLFSGTFGRNHPQVLTVRNGGMFTHYHPAGAQNEMLQFINERLGKDPGFMKSTISMGEERFNELVSFSRLKGIDLEKSSGLELKNVLTRYFSLYSGAYPAFHLSIFGDGLEHRDMLEKMAAFRLFSRESFNRAHENIAPLFGEIGKRIGLSTEEIKMLKPSEIEDLLDGKRLGFSDIAARRKTCYFIHENGKSELKENESISVEEEQTTEVRGVGTFPSFYSGVVRIVNSPQELEKLQCGDVLVTRMTTPDMISRGLDKAGAFVTDEGGATCHAAALSREFRIPAVFGTGNATKLLRDGDIVEIDAEKGTVKKK
jgi:phosphohistidine swiveling domain-containing protein